MIISPLFLHLLLLLLPNPTFQSTPQTILTIGSINADTFLPVARFPNEGENIVTTSDPLIDVPGGKGCNQAIAVSKLSRTTCESRFCCRFGNDAISLQLQQTLQDHGVVLDHCHTVSAPSGRGYVLLRSDGKVSAVVSPGSNACWGDDDDEDSSSLLLPPEEQEDLLENAKCVLLQREIPERVNLRIARAARHNGIPVVLDMGGEDRSISNDMLQACDYIMPNETELNRMIGSSSILNEEDVVERAKLLQQRGAKNVLITLGERGSVLVTRDGDVIRQPCYQLPDRCTVVDETGAGDCFRAAFVVAYAEGKSPRECMKFAAAAGALAVTKQGAVPAIPTRGEVEELCRDGFPSLRGGGGDNEEKKDDDDDEFPFRFGSRLNSMKDRPELSTFSNDVRGWVQRQSTIRGLDVVDFNYPQHFHEWTVSDAKTALLQSNLTAGAICIRYPHNQFRNGAMNHFDPSVRNQAIALTCEAANVAKALGCNHVVIWSAYDGYDYPFQVDHDEKWNQLISAFRDCCDAHPDVLFSLEFKPTDENTRFFTVPSTGAAMLLVERIDRPNMGLTLDFGHCLMAGENPAQSIALVGNKLFGIQLNDGYTRLAAEDGMMFGSVHPGMALEAMYYLKKINYKGHLYFDTFPGRTDPVQEAEYNIRKVKQFWNAAKKFDGLGIQEVMKRHDAVGALDLMEDILRKND